MMNVWNLRQTVLNQIGSHGKISPNSKAVLAYKAALPELSVHLLAVAVGLMLGDVSLQSNASGTAHRIKFEWGDVHKAYAFYVYSLFEMYCLSAPRKQVRVNANGNEVTTWCFQTVSHPAFNVLASIFLVDGKKFINYSSLVDVFTPVSLAFWYMDDGGLLSYSPNRYGLQLHTQGFSKAEVEGLIRLLSEKYDLRCWIKPNKGLWTIAISGHSYDTFYDLVKDHIHKSMVHKLPK